MRDLRPTVADLLAIKGNRQLSMLRLESLGEAVGRISRSETSSRHPGGGAPRTPARARRNRGSNLPASTTCDVVGSIQLWRVFASHPRLAQALGVG
jgi:hypothetical protein